MIDSRYYWAIYLPCSGFLWNFCGSAVLFRLVPWGSYIAFQRMASDAWVVERWPESSQRDLTGYCACEDRYLDDDLSHTIHGTGIFTYIYLKNPPNVGKCLHTWIVWVCSDFWVDLATLDVTNGSKRWCGIGRSEKNWWSKCRLSFCL